MSGALIARGNTLHVGAFRLAKMGLVVRGKPSEVEWEECGQVLRRIEGAVQFWIGDWVNYGEKAYGEKYDDAERITGLDYGTLANYAWVASKVESSSRDENLGFKVHMLVDFLRDAVNCTDWPALARKYKIPEREGDRVVNANGAQLGPHASEPLPRHVTLTADDIPWGRR
jgi:hypothetical protein